MKFILGTKEKMTQTFREDGKVLPATLLKVGPVTVTQIKTEDRDGYSAVQVGFGSKSNKAHRYVKEFRGPVVEGLKVGDVFDVSSFTEGDVVQLSAFSKGKGFQGVVKRHGFAGGPRTHGQKHSEREGGSIGSMGIPRVMKGKKMPGRTGNERVSLRGVEILQVDAEAGEILVLGGVPGRRGTLVEIKGEGDMVLAKDAATQAEKKDAEESPAEEKVEK
jgi:large subunit ribosomal protein L3